MIPSALRLPALRLNPCSSAAPQRVPGPHEVVFCGETDDSPGLMLWRYPEPRVLTFVRITPVPFNTTEDPDISTADLGDVLQVRCRNTRKETQERVGFFFSLLLLESLRKNPKCWGYI